MKIKSNRKITAFLSSELLEGAQKVTGKGITETLRAGLRLVAAGEAYEKLRKMRGKLKLQIDLDALRAD